LPIPAIPSTAWIRTTPPPAVAAPASVPISWAS
jgi:hypothetical protein